AKGSQIYIKNYLPKFFSQFFACFQNPYFCRKYTNMEISGRIKKTFDEQTFASGFRKKEIVITTQEQYPQDILVEFTQDKIDLLKPLSVGDEVKISINIRGREWINPEGVAKYFNSIQGWRIEKLGNEGPALNQYADMPPVTEDYLAGSDEPDDLPF